MTLLEWLELTGTIAFFAFAVVLAWIAVHLERFTRYGQEALLAGATLSFTAGLMRMLVFVSWLDREQAVIVNSVGAVTFLLIGVQLIVLREVQIHYRRREQ